SRCATRRSSSSSTRRACGAPRRSRSTSATSTSSRSTCTCAAARARRTGSCRSARRRPCSSPATCTRPARSSPAAPRTPSSSPRGAAGSTPRRCGASCRTRTASGTPSRPTCSREAPTCARSSSSSATRRCRRRSATAMSTAAGCAGCTTGRTLARSAVRVRRIRLPRGGAGEFTGGVHEASVREPRPGHRPRFTADRHDGRRARRGRAVGGEKRHGARLLAPHDLRRRHQRARGRLRGGLRGVSGRARPGGLPLLPARRPRDPHAGDRGRHGRLPERALARPRGAALVLLADDPDRRRPRDARHVAAGVLLRARPFPRAQGVHPGHRGMTATAAHAIRARAAGENFSVAPLLLGRATAARLHAIYDFARLVDELGDSAEGDRLRLLDDAEAELDRAFAGEAAAPVFRALEPLIADCSLPRGPFVRLIDANRRDQLHPELATYEELLDYCTLSANPVGELVLHVFGAATPERVALSDSVCTGLQLVEHWQDVAEDARNGRVYLPAEDRERFGVEREQLVAPHASERLRRLLAFE